MSEKLIQPPFEDYESHTSPEKREGLKPREKEKQPQPVITAYVIRHGESQKDKMNPRRRLTEKGKEQATHAAEKIAAEIIAETPPDIELELRGYDSGMDRANETLLEIAKILTEKGYKIYLPKHTQEMPEPGDSTRTFVDNMREMGQIHGQGPGIRKRIRNITLPPEARKELMDLAEQRGEDIVFTILTMDPKELEKKGVETPDEMFGRFNTALEKTNEIAQRIKFQQGNSKRKTIVIATSHGGNMETFITRKLGIELNKLGEVPEAEGFKAEFSGNKGQEPYMQVWGDELEKRLHSA